MKIFVCRPGFRRFVCAVLVLALSLSCGIVCFASPDTQNAPSALPNNDLPVIVVRGLDFGELYLDLGEENEQNAIKRIEASDIIRTLFKAAAAGIRNLSIDKAVDELLYYVDDIFEYLRCDENGVPVYNVSSREYPLAVSNYPDLFSGYIGNEVGIVKTCAEYYGAENTYYFKYDWRLSPLDIADDIDTMVRRALAESGKDKVNLVCCSLGGIEAVAYFTKYGYSSVEKCLLLSSAFCGTYVASDLLNGRVKITADTLYSFVSSAAAGNKALSALLKILKAAGVFGAVSDFGQGFTERYADRAFEIILRDTFGQMPVMWGMMLNEDYDGALNYIFGGREKECAAFLKMIFDLRRMNENKRGLLLEAQRNGVEFAVAAGYNSPVAPVYERADENGDGTLESIPMSGGAVIAPYGKTLGDGYVPAVAGCLSPDNVVDVSPCIFRENTWMVRNGPHVGGDYGSEYAEFILRLLECEGAADVGTFAEYPQFLNYNNGSLTALAS